MAFTADEITAKNFNEFYARIYPYLNGAAHAGFTPVGTIISVMGNSAPNNYLACDGSTKNIVLYPELAEYFNDQFGSKNFFGGDGTTTFAVPDLRGEFLRGTGTNSHSNQGNGANVGTHQDATVIPNRVLDATNKLLIAPGTASTASNYDKNIPNDTAVAGNAFASFGTSTATGVQSGTVRPTNTSVLYCIAYKNVLLDLRPWTLVGSVTGNSDSVNVPAGYSELFIVITSGTSVFYGTVPAFVTGTEIIVQGYSYVTTYCGGASVSIENSAVTLYRVYVNGSDFADAAVLTVYYR